MYDSFSIYDEPFSTYSDSFGTYGSSINDSAAEALVGGIFAFLAAFSLIFVICGIAAIVTLIAKWKVFKKAGKKPWESLIFIHNTIVEMDLGGIETYWYFLQFVPVIGGIAAIAIHFWKCIALAKAFGKSTGFGVLMGFFGFVGYPILAFGNSQYIGPQSDVNIFSQSNNSYGGNAGYNNYSNNANYNSVPNNMNQNSYGNATQINQYQPVNGVAPQQPAQGTVAQSSVQTENTFETAGHAQATTSQNINQPTESAQSAPTDQPVQESLFETAPATEQPAQPEAPTPADIPNTGAAESVNSDNTDM